MRSRITRSVAVVSGVLAVIGILLLPACGDLRQTCNVWPSAAEARAMDKSELPTYVAEMRAFINTVVPKMRSAMQAKDRDAVKIVQADVCKFNARWPIKSPRNHDVSTTFDGCFWTAEDTYFFGATLEFKPPGGLDYGILLAGYTKDCLERLNKFSPSQ